LPTGAVVYLNAAVSQAHFFSFECEFKSIISSFVATSVGLPEVLCIYRPFL